MGLQTNGKRILLLAIVLGAISAVLIRQFMMDLQNEALAATAAPTKSVVVPVQDIPANTVITRDMVTLKALPEEFILHESITNIDDAADSIATVDLYKDEPILDKRLVKDGERNAGLHYLVPEGKRAITISVDELNGFNGMLDPGYAIDMIAVIPEEKDGDVSYIVGTILQNVEVLATGAMTSVTPQNSSMDGEDYATLTLLVTPQEAELVTYITSVLEARLTLRPASDTSVVPAKPFTQQQLLELMKS